MFFLLEDVQTVATWTKAQVIVEGLAAVGVVEGGHEAHPECDNTAQSGKGK